MPDVIVIDDSSLSETEDDDNSNELIEKRREKERPTAGNETTFGNSDVVRNQSTALKMEDDSDVGNGSDGRSSIPSVVDLTQSSSISTMRSCTNNKLKMSSRSLSATTTTTTNDEDSADDHEEEKKDEIETKERNTSKKNIESRVYARFRNGKYYWGTILKKSECGHQHHYSVLFDGGERLNNIPDPYVWTVEDYRKKFPNGDDPPRSISSPYDQRISRPCRTTTRKQINYNEEGESKDDESDDDDKTLDMNCDNGSSDQSDEDLTQAKPELLNAESATKKLYQALIMKNKNSLQVRVQGPGIIHSFGSLYVCSLMSIDDANTAKRFIEKSLNVDNYTVDDALQATREKFRTCKESPGSCARNGKRKYSEINQTSKRVEQERKLFNDVGEMAQRSSSSSFASQGADDKESMVSSAKVKTSRKDIAQTILARIAKCNEGFQLWAAKKYVCVLKSKEEALAAKETIEDYMNSCGYNFEAAKEKIRERHQSANKLLPIKSATEKSIHNDVQKTSSCLNLDEKKEIGSRVFARWIDGKYFWGCITNKYKEAPDSKEYVYSVKFDDGDFLEKVPHLSINTVKRYRELFGEGPDWEPPEARLKKRLGTSSSNKGAAIQGKNDRSGKKKESKAREEIFLPVGGGCTGNEKVIGSRVYCAWPENDDWYWGIIKNKVRKGDKYTYSVKFDDGDYLSGLEEDQVWTVNAYKKLFCDEPPPLPQWAVDEKQPASADASVGKKKKKKNKGTERIKDATLPDDKFEDLDDRPKKRPKGGEYNETVNDFGNKSPSVHHRGNKCYRIRSDAEKKRIVEDFLSGPYRSVGEFADAKNKGKMRNDANYLVECSLTRWVKKYNQGQYKDADEGSGLNSNNRKDNVNGHWCEGQSNHMETKNVHFTREERLKIIQEYYESPYDTVKDFLKAWNNGKTDVLHACTLDEWLYDTENFKDEDGCQIDAAGDGCRTLSFERRGKKNYRTRSEEDKRKLVQEFVESNESNADFINGKNGGKNRDDEDFLAPTTFAAWVKKYSGSVKKNGNDVHADLADQAIESSKDENDYSANSKNAEGCRDGALVMQRRGNRVYRMRSDNEKERLVQQFHDSSHEHYSDFVNAKNKGKDSSDEDYLVHETFRRWLQKFSQKNQNMESSENQSSDDGISDDQGDSDGGRGRDPAKYVSGNKICRNRTDAEKKRLVQEYVDSAYFHAGDVKSFVEAKNKGKRRDDKDYLVHVTFVRWLHRFDRDDLSVSVHSSYSTLSEPISSATRKSSRLQAIMTLKELHVKRCQKCVLCTRPDCMRCAACLRNQEFEKKDTAVKEQAPEENTSKSQMGDKGADEMRGKVKKSHEGIVAVGSKNESGEETTECKVGGSKTEDVAENDKQNMPKEIGAQPVKKKVKPLGENGIAESIDQNEEGVRAENEKNKKGAKHEREVCLRKMCCAIEVNDKAQPAMGFAPGWRFVFEIPKTSQSGVYPNSGGLDGLLLLAPSGRRYRSIEAACSHHPKQLSDITKVKNRFLAYVGVDTCKQDMHDLLVGRGIRQEWTDVDGNQKVIYGVIRECDKDPRDENNVQFIVDYDEDSRLFANAVKNCCGSTVPETRKVKFELAWGGCLMFEQEKMMKTLETSESYRKIQSWTWLTPFMRNEELVDMGNGVTLPTLTLVVRGYKLTFTPKTSSIPNAGYGVFVKISKFAADAKGGSNFELKRGELIDLGVYAPFRKEDRRSERVFFAKNFVHSYMCEEWSFDTENVDYMFDISDDCTGDAHYLARKHIPSYVNECKTAEVPTVHAEHDPEGNVHYLFGVVDPHIENLSIPTTGDADEREIFINYGPLYETVRLRKGYSELPEARKLARLKELEGDDHEYLAEIENFSAEEAIAVAEYLCQLITSDDAKRERGETNNDELLGLECRQRVLLVLQVIEEKGKALLQTTEDGTEVNGEISTKIQQMLLAVETMIKTSLFPIDESLKRGGADKNQLTVESLKNISSCGQSSQNSADHSEQSAEVAKHHFGNSREEHSPHHSRQAKIDASLDKKVITGQKGCEGTSMLDDLPVVGHSEKDAIPLASSPAVNPSEKASTSHNPNASRGGSVHGDQRTIDVLPAPADLSYQQSSRQSPLLFGINTNASGSEYCGNMEHGTTVCADRLSWGSDNDNIGQGQQRLIASSKKNTPAAKKQGGGDHSIAVGLSDQPPKRSGAPAARRASEWAADLTSPPIKQGSSYLPGNMSCCNSPTLNPKTSVLFSKTATQLSDMPFAIVRLPNDEESIAQKTTQASFGGNGGCESKNGTVATNCLDIGNAVQTSNVEHKRNQTEELNNLKTGQKKTVVRNSFTGACEEGMYEVTFTEKSFGMQIIYKPSGLMVAGLDYDKNPSLLETPIRVGDHIIALGATKLQSASIEEFKEQISQTGRPLTVKFRRNIEERPQNSYNGAPINDSAFKIKESPPRGPDVSTVVNAEKVDSFRLGVKNTSSSQGGGEATKRATNDLVVNTEEPFPSKYCTEVRKRTNETDGTFRPVKLPRRLEDGTYQRPAGRTRKGMDWSANTGLWVPRLKGREERSLHSNASTSEGATHDATTELRVSRTVHEQLPIVSTDQSSIEGSMHDEEFKQQSE